MAAEPASPPTAPETSHFLGLAKQTLVYGLSGVALQAVGVITLPIYGHLFSQAEFGLLELATVLSAVALALIDAGFASAAQRSFYDYTDEELGARRAVIFTAIAFTSCLAATRLTGGANTQARATVPSPVLQVQSNSWATSFVPAVSRAGSPLLYDLPW